MFSVDTVKELKKGNPAAFKQAFTLLYPRLKSYCKLFIHDLDKVEDLIQETFISVWDNRSSIKTNKTIESYFFVILRNKCLNHLKKKRLETAQVVDLDNLKIDELQFLYQLDFTNKEEMSFEEQLVESLKVAINDLPEKMKRVFTLCKLEGRKQKEVAEELNISLKMVEKHVANAKKQIKSKLIRQYPTLIVIINMMLE